MERRKFTREFSLGQKLRMIACINRSSQSQRRRSSSAFSESFCCLLLMTDIFGCDRAWWLRQICRDYPLLITAVVVAKSPMSLLCPRTST
jgi:hypothetical protein